VPALLLVLLLAPIPASALSIQYESAWQTSNLRISACTPRDCMVSFGDWDGPIETDAYDFTGVDSNLTFLLSVDRTPTSIEIDGRLMSELSELDEFGYGWGASGVHSVTVLFRVDERARFRLEGESFVTAIASGVSAGVTFSPAGQLGVDFFAIDFLEPGVTYSLSAIARNRTSTRSTSGYQLSITLLPVPEPTTALLLGLGLAALAARPTNRR
jgi:hypothetical protein